MDRVRVPARDLGDAGFRTAGDAGQKAETLPFGSCERRGWGLSRKSSSIHICVVWIGVVMVSYGYIESTLNHRVNADKAAPGRG